MNFFVKENIFVTLPPVPFLFVTPSPVPCWFEIITDISIPRKILLKQKVFHSKNPLCDTDRFRCGSRIWYKGGTQLLRPKVADIAKRSRVSKASILRPGSRARLRALEAFGFLMLEIRILDTFLETLFLLFLTSILTPKVDKNRALDFTSINLRHSDMLHLFFSS